MIQSLTPFSVLHSLTPFMNWHSMTIARSLTAPSVEARLSSSSASVPLSPNSFSYENHVFNYFSSLLSAFDSLDATTKQLNFKSLQTSFQCFFYILATIHHNDWFHINTAYSWIHRPTICCKSLYTPLKSHNLCLNHCFWNTKKLYKLECLSFYMPPGWFC